MRRDGADVHLAADLAHAEDERLHPGDFALGRLVGGEVGGAADRAASITVWAGAAGERRDALPDLLGDEGHERMQRALQRLEHLEPACGACRASRRGEALSRLQHRLGELQVPVAELVPGELVERGGGDSRSGSRRRPLSTVPSMRPKRERIQRSATDSSGCAAAGRRRRVAPTRHHHEARRVPQLVAEVAVALARARGRS